MFFIVQVPEQAPGHHERGLQGHEDTRLCTLIANSQMNLTNYKDLFKKMQEWKVINPYHVHVRCKKSAERDYHVKMSLQLYQARNKKTQFPTSIIHSFVFFFYTGGLQELPARLQVPARGRRGGRGGQRHLQLHRRQPARHRFAH